MTVLNADSCFAASNSWTQTDSSLLLYFRFLLVYPALMRLLNAESLPSSHNMNIRARERNHSHTVIHTITLLHDCCPNQRAPLSERNPDSPALLNRPTTVINRPQWSNLRRAARILASVCPNACPVAILSFVVCRRRIRLTRWLC